ncbi:MAG: 16S rRNA (uracil(1498)-N(3))-methyltransferase [Chromatocurvus sp.]
MNILLFSPDERVPGTAQVRLCGARAEHIRTVYGAVPGKSLRAGEIGGDIGEATLESIAGNGVTLTFRAQHPPPAKRPLTVILALPRPKMLRRMLRTVAESGVRELHLVNARRVEKSFWQSGLLETASLEGYLLSGLEQSMDTVLPALHLHRGFRPFAEDSLPALATGRRALLAHPGAGVSCPADGDGETLLMIGPEGGFIDYETTLAQRAGMQPVSLGSRTLRAETALAAMLGRFLATP